MKKSIFFILAILFSVSLFAEEKVENNAVTMVSYEQSWLDSEGTLALKNNTEQTITSVSFRLCYYSMGGEQLDYKEFTKKTDIAPSMTRKVDVEAYEHDRFYNYYKSERCPGNGTSFKLTFELIGYKTSGSVKTSATDGEVVESLMKSEDDEEAMVNLVASDYSNRGLERLGIVMTPLTIYFCILALLLLIITPFMAMHHGRNAFGWTLLALIVSPFVALLLLALVGRLYEMEEQMDEDDEEDVRKDIDY